MYVEVGNLRVKCDRDVLLLYRVINEQAAIISSYPYPSILIFAELTDYASFSRTVLASFQDEVVTVRIHVIDAAEVSSDPKSIFFVDENVMYEIV